MICLCLSYLIHLDSAIFPYNFMNFFIHFWHSSFCQASAVWFIFGVYTTHFKFSTQLTVLYAGVDSHKVESSSLFISIAFKPSKLNYFMTALISFSSCSNQRTLKKIVIKPVVCLKHRSHLFRSLRKDEITKWTRLIKCRNTIASFTRQFESGSSCSYCDELGTVVAGSFTHGKVTRSFDKNIKNPPSTNEDAQRCSKRTQFAQISNAVWNTKA